MVKLSFQNLIGEYLLMPAYAPFANQTLILSEKALLLSLMLMDHKHYLSMMKIILLLIHPKE